MFGSNPFSTTPFSSLGGAAVLSVSAGIFALTLYGLPLPPLSFAASSVGAVLTVKVVPSSGSFTVSASPVTSTLSLATLQQSYALTGEPVTFALVQPITRGAFNISWQFIDEDIVFPVGVGLFQCTGFEPTLTRHWYSSFGLAGEADAEFANTTSFIELIESGEGKMSFAAEIELRSL
jgi:hypothetical protein